MLDSEFRPERRKWWAYKNRNLSVSAISRAWLASDRAIRVVLLSRFPQNSSSGMPHCNILSEKYSRVEMCDRSAMVHEVNCAKDGSRDRNWNSAALCHRGHCQAASWVSSFLGANMWHPVTSSSLWRGKSYLHTAPTSEAFLHKKSNRISIHSQYGTLQSTKIFAHIPLTVFEMNGKWTQ